MTQHDQKTILLVEDEPVVAAAETEVVKQLGYQVIIAYTGNNAVKLAVENKSIDLILMDIDLSKSIDGTKAARQILSKRTLPIVFLTAHSEKEYIDKLKEITHYGCVIKGSGDFVLQSSIEMAFELFEAHENVKIKMDTLTKALEEKETFFQGLWHSVINSLSIISSMVNLEAFNASDDVTRNLLSRIRDRMRSFSRLYDIVSVLVGMSKIRLDEYLLKIIDYLKDSYLKETGMIVLHSTFDPVTIEVTLEKQPARVSLTASDNGIGLPERFDIEHSTGLGMQFVHLVVKDLDGELSILADAKTTFGMKAPLFCEEML